MYSHASNPVAEHIGAHLFRVYFSCRDKENRSAVAWVDLDLHSSPMITRVADEPLIIPGERGLFDDSGTTVCCLLTHQSARYLYYLGWNLSITVPFRNSIGLAIAEEGSPVFRKFSRAPILDRSELDPFTLSYPWVLRDGQTWKMWYGSTLFWGPGQADMTHSVKYAESRDGIHWERTGIVCLDFKDGSEYAVSRPCVIKEDGIYKMWYSYRGQSYRIGYAESADGIRWDRKDDLVGLDVSASGWDSEMIEYPFVFDDEGSRYMLYNGNGYGRSGFGLAVLDRSVSG